jgi:alpha-1,3-rhamnosyl/mannosyltransferase
MTEQKRTFRERVLRSLARRFPLIRRAFNWVRAYANHLKAKYGSRLRPKRLLKTVESALSAWSILATRRGESRLTVGVDISALWEPLTGIGWYLYRLLEHLADREDLRLRLYGPTSVWSEDLPHPVVPLPEGPALEPVLRRVPSDLAIPAGWMVKLLRCLEPLLIAADKNDVLFAPNYFLPRRFQLAQGARVATIHDLGLHRVPWTLQRATLEELKGKLEHQVFESSRLITVSGAVREELKELGYAEPERVRVVHHGPGQLSAVEPSPLPEGLPSQFGLHVGTLEPRKNIEVLIKAWRLVRHTLRPAPALILCGRYGWKAESIRSSVEKATTERWLFHLGYVEDAQLAALYRQASVVVFPSLYEGFGLPAVEALQAEVPLVCSDIPVLRETTAGAALFAPVERPDVLADRIRSVLTDERLRGDLIAAGRRRAAELSWDRAADSTAGLWFEAAGRSEEIDLAD